MYSLSIIFEDGSIPYYGPAMSAANHKKRLREWKRLYSMELIKTVDSFDYDVIEFYIAKQK